MQAIASVLNRLDYLLGQWLNRTFLGDCLAMGWQPPRSTERGGQAYSSITRQLLALSMSLSCLAGITGCSSQSSAPPRYISLQQTWELQPGDHIAGHLVSASLGDVTIELDGSAVHAPFDGEVEPAAQAHCVFFSSPEVPAYLFRLCGLSHPQLGQLKLGQVIGKGDYLHFATLRRQPEGTWAIVEPSSNILERALQPNPQSTSTRFRPAFDR